MENRQKQLRKNRIGEIYNNSKEINFDILIYYHKNPKLTPINFIDFKGPMYI